ncbi:MAG: hypothetical protein ACK5MQ_17180 [Pikeienuella sp.]
MRRDLCNAVNLSAILGWLLVAALYLDFMSLSWIWVFAAIFGLPVAFLVCWLVVAPVLWRIMRRPIPWTRAIGWGAAVSTLLAMMGVAFAQSTVFHQPDSLALFQSAATFVAGGVLIALALRTLIGPGAPG